MCRVLCSVYDTYSFHMIPVMGQVIAGDWKSYQYLVESIRQFPPQVRVSCCFIGCVHIVVVVLIARRLRSHSYDYQSSCTSVFMGLHLHTLLTSFVRWQMSRLVSDFVPVHLRH